MTSRSSSRSRTRASYAASLLFVLVGIAISLFGSSINAMFTWIMAVLGAGVLMPNVLRWYWARLNGWGYFSATVTGVVLAMIQQVLESTRVLVLPIYVTFPTLALAVMVVAIVVALLTEPTGAGTLKTFYREVQPAGAWGRVAEQVREEDPGFKKEPFGPDLLNVILAVPWLASLYTAPILLVTHQYAYAAIAGGVVVILSVALVFTWWRRLPKASIES